MTSLLLAVEPFWGRAIVYNVATKEEIELSIQLVLSNDYDSSYQEAVNVLCDLKNQLQAQSLITFSTIVIEVSEAQSDETQQAILAAAKNSGFEKAELVLYENTRLLWALNYLMLDSNSIHENLTVAVADIWQNEAFGYLLECKKVSSGIVYFTPCRYYSIQSQDDEGFEISELKNFAQKLFLNQKVEAVIIASGDYDNACRDIFINPIFYDADEKRGTVLKAIALCKKKEVCSPTQVDMVHIDVADTLEYSLKLIIGDQKHNIAEAYEQLPITFEKVITLDKPVSTLEFCRQWPSSEICESYGRTSFDPKNFIAIKCEIDRLRKINLTIK